MKKLLKLFGLLIAFGTLFCLSGCGNLLNKSSDDDYSEPINHTFVRDMTMPGDSFVYYNSTKAFSYKDNASCYYQIKFNAGKKTWMLYTRTTASSTPIEEIAGGTFTGSPSKEGELTLTSADEKTATQTVTVAKNSDDILSFVADVVASHKYLGAKDSK